MNHPIRNLRFTYFCLALVSPAFAAYADGLDDARRYLAATYAADRPGAAVIIASNGEIVHQAGYGLANVELNVPISNDTVFRIGSITKQFTAAAIMLMQQRNQLSVSDPVAKYLPDYPTHGHDITIEHLLTHTSGIKSYTNVAGYMETRIRDDLTTAALIDVFDHLPMEFAPGERWNYNNSGYVLLGAIIEAVSGQAYEDYIAEQIAAPLELEHTVYGGPKLVPNRASGYSMDDDGNVVNAAFLSMTQPHAAGSLLSTTGDLFDWHQGLTSGEFIHDDSYESMTTPVELNDGTRYPYGYGLAISETRGRRSIEHSGGIHGFSAFSIWLPDTDIYVAVLSNGATRGPSPETVGNIVAAMMVDDPYPERIPVALTEEDVAGISGDYGAENFAPVTVTVKDGGLTMNIGEFFSSELLAESREHLFMPDSLSTIDVVWADSIAGELHLHMNEGQPPTVLIRDAE